MTYIGELRRTAGAYEISCLNIRIFHILKVISRKQGGSRVVPGRPDRVRSVGTGDVKLAYKPGSVQGSYPLGSHSSRPSVTRWLQQPTREQREPRCRSPIWPCSGWGLACRLCHQRRGGLLPAAHPKACRHAPLGGAHRFTLACARKRAIGGVLSVQLSVASRLPAVSRHPALRSPDFPLYQPSSYSDCPASFTRASYLS
jgi:hypothetical protein